MTVFVASTENEDQEEFIFTYPLLDTSTAFFTLLAILNFSQGEQRRSVGVFPQNRF